MNQIESQQIIDNKRIDQIWQNCTETECRNFAKASLRFLRRGQEHVKRMLHLKSRGLEEDARLVAGKLREDSCAIGALRLQHICGKIETLEPHSPELSFLYDALEKEMRAAELRIWELVHLMGVESARRAKVKVRELNLPLRKLIVAGPG